jgi:hypothetical protein
MLKLSLLNILMYVDLDTDVDVDIEVVDVECCVEDVLMLANFGMVDVLDADVNDAM